MERRELTRRDFLERSSVTATGVLLAACTPVAPSAAPAAVDSAASAAVPAAAEEDTLTFATDSPWGTFSPFRPTYQYGYNSNYIAMLTHSQLISLDHKKDVKPEDIVEHHAPAWYTPELNLDSGPFKFVKAERDQFVELVRNDDYYGSTPKVGRILFQQNLADVGVKTQLQFMEGTSATDAQTSCDFDMYYQGWGFAFPEDYDSFFTDAECCTTPWGDPDAKALFDKTTAIVDEAERRAIHNELQVRFNDELPMLPFLQFTGVAALNQRVSSFDDDALWHRFYQWNNSFNNAVNWSVGG